ncbi:MAG: T9SS type A sorting domain-containing protein, partial [Ignavibacteriales bacterium]|nr:T9SS type A sorting domain-containing protein [Ignavibacteriales bacterium]
STDIYCQRILSTGQAAWLANGLPICTAQNTQWNVQIIPDTIGGAIISWQDRRNSTYDNIFAQRIDAYGNIKWMYNGIQIAQTLGTQYYPQMISDWSGGAIIIWQDNRKGTDYDIFAQRINREGGLLWGTSGTDVCAAIGHQYNPRIIFQNSYFIVAWQDKRHNDFDIYAQRLNLQGQPLWSSDGNPVATLPLDQFMPQITIDGANGAIITWADYHLNNGSTDLYSQRIGANGLPAGGCYRTFIQDSLGSKSKRFKRSNRIISIPNAGNVRDSIFRRGVFPYGLFIGVERRDSLKKYGWIRYTRASMVRRALPQSGMPRPFDWIVDRLFVGEKKNLRPLRYDNQVVGELLALKLNIAASDAGITQGQLGDIVFQDTTQNNPLNNKKLRQIASTVDSMLTMWSWYKNLNYSLIGNTLQRINAAFHGIFDTISTSPLRFTSTQALFSVPFLRPSVDPPTIIPEFHAMMIEDELPENFALLQNYPNPFNPLTTIEFNLPEPATVTLKIYNILGQEVGVLIDHTMMEDDNYIIDFYASSASGGLSSGVYFYRLLAEPLSGGEVRNLVKKMVVLK